eukprot:2144113-Lingulodinium_polyedra.AAC.1
MLELGNRELLSMLCSGQHLEARIGEAVGMLDAARAAAEVAAEVATIATQAASTEDDHPVDSAAPFDAEGFLIRARHDELDECKDALVRAAVDIAKQAQQIQAQQGDP